MSNDTYQLGEPTSLPPLKWAASSLTRIIHAQCEAGTFDKKNFKDCINPYEEVMLDYDFDGRLANVKETLGGNLIDRIPEEYLVPLVDGSWAKQASRDNSSLLYTALGKGKFKLARAIAEAGINNSDGDIRASASRCLDKIFEDLERPIEWAGRYSGEMNQEQYAKDLFDFALFAADLYLKGEEIKETSQWMRRDKQPVDLPLACMALNFNPLHFMQICIKNHLHEGFLYVEQHPLVAKHMPMFAHQTPAYIIKTLGEDENHGYPSYLRRSSCRENGPNLDSFSLFDVAFRFNAYPTLDWLKEKYFDQATKAEQEKTALSMLKSLQRLWTDTENSHEDTKTKEKQTLMGIRYSRGILTVLDGSKKSYESFRACLKLLTPLSTGALLTQFPKNASWPQRIKGGNPFDNREFSFSASEYNLIHYCQREIDATVHQKECAPISKTIDKVLAVENPEFLPLLLERIKNNAPKTGDEAKALWEEIHLRLLSGITKKTAKPKL